MEQKHYEINLKQGDLCINLSSDDVYFISKQMDKWFKVLMDDRYVPITIPPGLGNVAQSVPVQPVAPPPVYEAPPAPQPVAPEAVAPPAPAPVEVPVAPAPVVEAAPPVQVAPPPPAPAPVVEAPAPVSQQEVAPQPTPAPMPEPAVVAPEPVYAPQPEIPVAPAPAPEPVAPPPGKVLAETVEDDFEAVMDSLMKDLGETVEDAPLEANPFPAPVMESAPPMPEAYAQAPANVEDYALPPAVHGNGNGAALAQPKERVNFEMINSLSELCGKSQASTSDDFLLMSAFYITCFEGLEKFSLKRINSMLVKSGLTPVNHSVLETALSHGHLSMVPDLTGTAEATEYTLTDGGMDAAHQLL